MKITGTFLDEISYDIPHQNWGRREWRRDFLNMRSIGIDTVIMIRCGLKQWLTYPSEILMRRQNCYRPVADLVEMFLELSDELGMKFFFGTYDSWCHWHSDHPEKELELNLQVVEEAWLRYGHHKSFAGWYLSQEISRGRKSVATLYRELGRCCKEVSGGLPVLISPLIDGVKENRKQSVSLEDHQREWDEMFSLIRDGVDTVAFQDGHCEFHELSDYLAVNRQLAEKYGIECWSNCESFDRDMPIRFLPIKWEKMRFKLRAAEAAGVRKVITFEFSHFMSPNSVYGAAGNLYHRYCEEYGISTAMPEN
ncbi:DUF4434 domain-containing protein [Victivallis vadensis]|uniref:DUF4434 domain-containing protein n=1 Tax=Victivallis vadensis TaxID=172901 RepID=A0A848AVV4_9BACT|nr:DUF4434 domain-containing protein [Victivallis vadensis]NMD85072.1 DUF4434 domain-containing protein [Victivallis vadensis]